MVTKGATKTLALELKTWVRRKLFPHSLRMTEAELAAYAASLDEQVAHNERLNLFALQMLEYRVGKFDELTRVRMRFLSEELLFAMGHEWATFKSKSDVRRWMTAHNVKPEE